MADDSPIGPEQVEALALVRSLVTSMLGDDDESTFLALLHEADLSALRNGLAMSCGMITGMVTSVAGQTGSAPSAHWQRMIAEGVVGPTG